MASEYHKKWVRNAVATVLEQYAKTVRSAAADPFKTFELSVDGVVYTVRVEVPKNASKQPPKPKHPWGRCWERALGR